MGVASGLLRPRLLQGRRVALVGSGPAAGACRAALTGLEARVALVDEGPPPTDDGVVAAALEAALAQLDGLDALVVDADGLARRADLGAGPAALRAALDGSWAVVREAGRQALRPAPDGGLVVLLAPPPRAVAHASALRAGLENLARTLSIEWARDGVRTVAVLPGELTVPDEVAALVAYLVSPAGAYFSGCRLELGALAAAAALTAGPAPPAR